MMNGKNASIKQAWVSVVDAQNIKDAKREAGKKLWFSLSPGKEWFGNIFNQLLARLRSFLARNRLLRENVFQTEKS